MGGGVLFVERSGELVTGELKIFSIGGAAKASVKSANEVSCYRPETR